MSHFNEQINRSPLLSVFYENFEQIMDLYVINNLMQLSLTIILIIMTYIIFNIGKHNGRKDALITRQMKERIQEADTKKQSYQNRTIFLQNKVKTFGRITKYQLIISLLLGAPMAFFYQDILPIVPQLYLEVSILVVMTMIICTRAIQFYYDKRRQQTNKLLDNFSKEKNQIGQNVAEKLGPELTAILKDQLFREETKKFEEQRRANIVKIQSDLSKLYQDEISVLKKKVTELERKALNSQEIHKIQQQQIHQQQIRAAQQPLTPIVQSPQQKQTINPVHVQLITLLKEERDIMKKFISGVCQFDWGEQCLRLAELENLNGLEADADTDLDIAAIKGKVQNYMKFSQNIGGDFNLQLKQWKQKRLNYKQMKKNMKKQQSF